MHIDTIATALLGLLPLAAATPSLKPWLISRLTTFAPSGRPGSSPWSVINITISDPNEITPTSAICSSKWTFEEQPYDIVNNCSDVPGAQWSFVMLEVEETESASPSPLTNFKLRFELKKGAEVFVGTEGFLIGDNLSGLCSASGICSFGLKEKKTPYPVVQEKVDASA